MVRLVDRKSGCGRYTPVYRGKGGVCQGWVVGVGTEGQGWVDGVDRGSGVQKRERVR